MRGAHRELAHFEFCIFHWKNLLFSLTLDGVELYTSPSNKNTAIEPGSRSHIFVKRESLVMHYSVILKMHLKSFMKVKKSPLW